jgi:hypothetical protein
MAERPWWIKRLPPVESQSLAYRGLLAGVLRRAIFDWVLYRDHPDVVRRRIAAEAYIWLFIEGPGYPTWTRRLKEHTEMLSFLSICESLCLSKDQVRRVAEGVSKGDIRRLGRPPTNRTGGYDD